MTGLGRHWGWVSRIRLWAASATVTLAVVLVLGAVATQSAQAQTFTDLYNFCSLENCDDGSTPYAALVRGAKGNLYGTTTYGGASGEGTVFVVDPSGTETVLYSFCQQSGCIDGAIPYSGVIRDAKGNLYGTTTAGGTSGEGTVFAVDPSGTETVLHSFAGGTTDGCDPYGGLVTDSSGNIYGAAYGCGEYSAGVIYELANSGGTYTESVVYAFKGGPDGANPQSSPVMDAKGRLYGTTFYGGGGGCLDGCGTAFRLTNSSGTWINKVLHTFKYNGVDGYYPYAGLTLDSEGNIYGTTLDGGSFQLGIVFILSPPKTKQKGYKETVFHTFYGDDDGQYPYAGVIMDGKGNLYGDTTGGGSGCGTVFMLSKTGKETILYSFTGAGGCSPYGNVIRDATGNLYGTAEHGGSGGSGGSGTVWKLTP